MLELSGWSNFLLLVCSWEAVSVVASVNVGVVSVGVATTCSVGE